MLRDIQSLTDIQALVHTFYGHIRTEPLLGPVFEDKIQDRWPEHLEKMIRFLQTVLLDEHTYFGSPFPPFKARPSTAESKSLNKPWMVYSKAPTPKKRNSKAVGWQLFFVPNTSIIRLVLPSL